MAQEYIALKENNDVGVIALSTAAFQAIAKNVIDEEENLKLAAGSKPFKYPLSCKIVNDQLILNLDVNVNDTCSKVQGKIFENIEHMTGYTPDVIDIRVVGFIF